MDLNGLFQALKDNRVKMPPGGLHIPEAFAQRAQYTPTRPFVPPSPWPGAGAGASKPTTKGGLGPNTTSVSSTMGSPGTTVSMTPVMEDYMRQLTQAIMTDPTGKTVATTVADLGQKIAHEALACAGLAPRTPAQPTAQTPVRPTPVRPQPATAPASAARPPETRPAPTATATATATASVTAPAPTTREPRETRASRPPETREAMTSPTLPQAVIEASAAATIPPPAVRFTRYAEAVRIACGLPGPMPDPSTPTTSFWNYMAELAEHTGVRIYVRVSPLFARCVGTSKRAIIIIDALNNAAEVLQPRGSMDDALTFLHDKDIDVEYTATTLKKYKVNEVQGVAQRYDVATHVADTGKKKVKDVLIQDILDDLAARVRVCEAALV